MATKHYYSPAVDLARIAPGFYRADIEFHGVDHSGASFQARVFLNNPNANEETELTDTEGYAGAFNIFGHGGCFGDDQGHCDVPTERRPFDPRTGHALTPAIKIVIATEAVRKALALTTAPTVTVVPVITSSTPRCDLEDVLKFEYFRIVTYR